MNITWFEPHKKALHKVTNWEIKPHRVRAYVIYHYDGTETVLSCLFCKKHFEYYDLAFRGYKDHYGKIQIRPQGYDKICFDCGIKLLTEITPKKLLPEFNQMLLEYQSKINA